jgi:YggT family protein
MAAIGSLVNLILYAFIIVLLVRVAFSWFNPYPNNAVCRLTYQITEPVLAPVRRVLPPMSGLDLSPLVVTLGIYFIAGFISKLFA